MRLLPALLGLILLLALASSCGVEESPALPSASTSPTPAASRTPAPTAGEVLHNIETQRLKPWIRAIGLVAPNTGWVLMDERLVITDGGGQWRDITSPGLTIDEIRGVLFLDGSVGWIAAVTPAPGDPSAATAVVLRTKDGGETWAGATVATPQMIWPGPPIVTQMYFDFVDAEHGWLSVDYRTGNMGQGLLYKTDDGGATWTKLAELAGGGGAVRFRNQYDGWWVGGGRQMMQVSHDGGKTWTGVPLTPPPSCESVYAYSPGKFPVFDASGNGAMPAFVTGCPSPAFYTTGDGGRSWDFSAMAPEPGPLAVAGPESWFASANAVLYTTHDAGVSWWRTDFGWSKLDPLAGTGESSYVGPQEMSFLDGKTGWAILRSEHYSEMMSNGKWGTVNMATILVATVDGGAIWTRLSP